MVSNKTYVPPPHIALRVDIYVLRIVWKSYKEAESKIIVVCRQESLAFLITPAYSCIPCIYHQLTNSNNWLMMIYEQWQKLIRENILGKCFHTFIAAALSVEHENILLSLHFPGLRDSVLC